MQNRTLKFFNISMLSAPNFIVYPVAELLTFVKATRYILLRGAAFDDFSETR